MSELLMMAMKGVGTLGESIGTALEPVTGALGTTDTVTRVTGGTADALTRTGVGMENLLPGSFSDAAIGAADKAISGVSKASGQVAGLVGPAMKAVPVGTAIASVASKPKAPKVKLPSGPTDTAIARASTRSQTRGAGGGRRAQSKAGYSSFGTA